MKGPHTPTHITVMEIAPGIEGEFSARDLRNHWPDEIPEPNMFTLHHALLKLARLRVLEKTGKLDIRMPKYKVIHRPLDSTPHPQEAEWRLYLKGEHPLFKA